MSVLCVILHEGTVSRPNSTWLYVMLHQPHLNCALTQCHIVHKCKWYFTIVSETSYTTVDTLAVLYEYRLCLWSSHTKYSKHTVHHRIQLLRGELSVQSGHVGMLSALISVGLGARDHRKFINLKCSDGAIWWLLHSSAYQQKSYINQLDLNV